MVNGYDSNVHDIICLRTQEFESPPHRPFFALASPHYSAIITDVSWLMYTLSVSFSSLKAAVVVSWLFLWLFAVSTVMAQGINNLDWEQVESELMWRNT